ncbi:LacI family DNA-binding transcriptional regulator [Motiliproteus sp. MSK22-1]|uniref:LacI family DNA-binding transcriptional regulator n=1 Tax=Motiliproteus sp. MSK22-1 TaxID=1897630 RepID=UPI000977788B|nr:LacI family DNA-binding transcriptional regulator [Motiliproteus sp. MSK22-1]OMH25744.1 LacI family transcriptional regulator [Motiliproteus sp. MSK22-1]
MAAPNSRKLTLKDVAKVLKVSTATISNAFNRPDQLSEQLRERILAQCSELGYFGPNAAARSLRTGRSGIIGVMLYDNLSYNFIDPVAQQFLQGLAEVFDESQHSMLLLPSQDRIEQARGLEAFVDGFIIYGPPLQQKLDRLLRQQRLEQLRHQSKPLITVDFNLENHLSVNIDNYLGARKSTEYAIDRSQSPGNIGIAILGLRLVDTNRVCRVREDELFDEYYSVSARRLHGYQDAIRDAGLTIPAEMIWNVPDNNHGSGYQAAREALGCSSRPNLLLCSSDRIALAAIQAARHLNLKVPEDVRIVGFDDIPEAATHHPTLTTVHQQTVEKGRVAAEIFLGRRAAESVVLPTELVVRESCP